MGVDVVSMGMKTWGRNRGLLVSGLWLVSGGCVAAGQATLPSAAPTVAHSASVTGAQGNRVAAQTSTGETETQRLKVTWVDGTLTIAAENAGLNQILREVSRRTGMKVTGGVADERVYGSYGPGPAETVLAGLLTGTKSNVLLEEATADHPMQLILSPRQGGASPPGPNTYGSVDDDREESAPEQPSLREPLGRRIGGYGGRRAGGGAPGSNGAQDAGGAAPVAGVPAQSVPDGSEEQGPPTSASPASGSGDTQSASEPKSPQEIYDQLMRLQQQQKNPQGPTANPPQ